MRTSFGLAIALALTVALASSFVTVGAQRPEVTAIVRTEIAPSAPTGFSGSRFVHIARSFNIVTNSTYIDHPLTNNNPDAIVLITQNWNPSGVGGQYNDHAIGVWYDIIASQWAIFNQDLASIPEGAAFNVLIPDADPSVFVHTATAGNISLNWTVIDHPLTNNNPNAIVLVTQNWNPGGGSGQYNDHAIGVWYSAAANKWAIFNQDLVNMPVDAAFNVLIPDADPSVFVHTATASNISSNWTVIDHPLTNNNPNAIVLVTQNWNPGGVGDQYNDHAIGVWFTGSNWAIFNHDLASMPEGADFNVSIPTNDSTVFVHTATASNISSNYTLIDHPLSNNNPNAIVLATQNWNPGGFGGQYNDHAIGVWYDIFSGKWSIFNQDIANMPEDAAFNVLVPTIDGSVFVHTATASNISFNTTYIDHPLTNNNPDAIVLISQNWNPSGVGGQYNDHAVGVWYDGSAAKWGIFNQDLASMPVDAAFNVVIPDADPSVFVHTATAGNISFNWTEFDHPRSNNRPNTIVLATQNWNPGDGSGQYNDRAIGVWFTGSKWAIFNQDLANMPVGADFNVAVYEVNKLFLPLIMRN